MTRFLRPGFLVLAGKRLWVVDEFQPVAAIIEPFSGELERLVSWTELPPPPPRTFASWYFGWRVVGAATPYLWVQPFRDGPVALIGTEGLVHASPSNDLRLAGADARGAWCIPQNSRRDLSPSRALLVIRPDGTITPSRAELPVRNLRTGTDGAWVRVDLPPQELPENSRDVEETTTWLHLPADRAVPRQLTVAAHRVESPEHVRARQHGPFFESVDHPKGQLAPEANGLVWNVGSPRTGPVGEHVIAVGHDPASGAERNRVDLGGFGQVRTVVASSGFVWTAVRRARRTSPYSPGAVELLRFDPSREQLANERSTGAPPESILPPESLDISEHCWPLPGKPAEADSYVRQQREYFGEMRWPGMNDVSAEVTGTWPHSTIRLTFTHTSRPGLRLVHSLPLFDELGRLQPPDYAGVHLYEALDTNRIPPASESVNGILHV